MKSDMRTIIRDIQAAARIGHVESLWAALDQLQDLPQISGNHPMNETLINQVVLPVGRAVSRTRINNAAMRPLITHPYAAYRAIAGTALLSRYLKGENHTSLKDLNGLVQDPREDVRVAIQAAVIQVSDANPQKLEEIYSVWQGSKSTRVQALAYQILPHLPEEIVLQNLSTFRDSLDEYSAEVRNALASALSSIGTSGKVEAVFDLLYFWAAQDDPDFRVVARSLSKPWAASYPQQTLEILTQLVSKVGPRKRIRKALHNLARNGAEEQVQVALEEWRNEENLNLRAAGHDAKLNI
jgi:hypothetical protein